MAATDLYIKDNPQYRADTIIDDANDLLYKVEDRLVTNAENQLIKRLSHQFNKWTTVNAYLEHKMLKTIQFYRISLLIVLVMNSAMSVFTPIHFIHPICLSFIIAWVWT